MPTRNLFLTEVTTVLLFLLNYIWYFLLFLPLSSLIFLFSTEKIMTSTSKGILRPFLIVCIILVCFMACLLIYIKPTNSWVFSPMESASSVLKMKNFFSTKTDYFNETTILVWVWPFGQTFDLTSCQAMFNIHGCHLTTDRSLYNKSHAVLIHHRDISWDLTNLPQQARPPLSIIHR